ncbi:MAG: hypothetical protein WCA22_05880 [Candidatus Binatus sp.]
MIIYRTLLDELERNDRLFCSDCFEHTLRHALIKAAQKDDRNFLLCENCREHWTPDPSDLAGAIRDWVLVFTTDDRMAAVLCAECAASHPEPAIGLPEIARLILWRSPDGPLQ